MLDEDVFFLGANVVCLAFVITLAVVTLPRWWGPLKMLVNEAIHGIIDPWKDEWK